MTMKCDVRDGWIADLRSGRFKQGRCRLLKDGAYCCLGVLAERLGCARGEPKADGSVPFIIKGAPVTKEYPPAFGGLSKEEVLAYAGMNDGGFSFDEIAKHIAAYVKCESNDV